MGTIFVSRVLCVVDEQIDLSSQLKPGCPICFPWERTGPERWLVIGQVSQGNPIFHDAVADRWPRVQHRRRANLQTSDGKGFGGEIMERETAWKIA
jgi:hypothetical protein